MVNAKTLKSLGTLLIFLAVAIVALQSFARRMAQVEREWEFAQRLESQHASAPAAAPAPVAPRPTPTDYPPCADAHYADVTSPPYFATVTLHPNCSSGDVIVPAREPWIVEDTSNGEFWTKFANEDGWLPVSLNNRPGGPFVDYSLHGFSRVQRADGTWTDVQVFKIRGSREGQTVVVKVKKPPPT